SDARQWSVEVRKQRKRGFRGEQKRPRSESRENSDVFQAHSPAKMLLCNEPSRSSLRGQLVQTQNGTCNSSARQNMTAKLAITLRVILFSIICPLILIVAGPLGRLVPSSGGPLLIGIVASLFTFALTLLFVRWEKIGLGDIGAGFSRRTAPRLLFGFAIGAAIVALQDLVIYSCGHVHWVIAVSPPSFRLLFLALAGYFALALRE